NQGKDDRKIEDDADSMLQDEGDGDPRVGLEQADELRHQVAEQEVDRRAGEDELDERLSKLEQQTHREQPLETSDGIQPFPLGLDRLEGEHRAGLEEGA